MKQYIDLTKDILQNGEWCPTRTAEDAQKVFGRMLTFDLREGFPAVTVKALPFKSVVAELLGFLRGATNVKEFQALGTSIWNANATSEYWLANRNCGGDGDLGRIYGAQWREYRGVAADGTIREVDQYSDLISSLRNDRFGRRHVVTAWNPAELDQMALPPCHMMFECSVSVNGELDMMVIMRSCDVFLGLPFNIASYALLLHVIAARTKLVPRRLVMCLGDTHLYRGQIEHATTMVERTPLPLPRLVMAKRTGLVTATSLHPEDFALEGYESHPALRVPMVV